MLKKILAILIFIAPTSLLAQKQGKELVDSILKVLPDIKDDTIKVKLLNNLSFNYSDISPDTGLQYAAQALALSEKVNYRKGIASAYSSFGINYTQLSDYDRALDYNFKSLKLYEELGYKEYVAGNLGNIANCYLSQGNIARAMEYQLKDLKIAEEIGNKKMIASSEMNIANIYATMQEYDKAKEFLFSALAKSREVNNKATISNCMINIAGIFFAEKKYDSSLKYHAIAQKIAEELGDKVGLQVIALNMGCSYRELGDYNNAVLWGNRSLQISKELSDNACIALSLDELGATYLKMYRANPSGKDNLAIATKDIQQAYEYIKDINDPGQQADIYKNLSEIYELTGRYKDALDLRRTYEIIIDSIISTDNRIKLANMRTQREADLKDEQIELNKIQHSKERNERIFFLIGIGLLSIILFVILKTYNRQKRSNVQLTSSNKQLEEEKSKSDLLAMYLQDSLREKDEVAARLATLMNTKSRFFGNISHELRTPVTLITGMLEMMKRKKLAGKEKEQIEVAYNNSRKLQHMVEEMLDLSRVENKQIVLNSAVKEIAPLLKRMVSAFESIVEKEQLTLVYDDSAAQKVYISVDEDKFEKIINNLVYNALKFNKKNGFIYVTASLSADKSNFVIEVKDTGIGINEQDLSHIFERFYQGSDNNRTKAEGVGIGLSLVKEFTVLMGGTVDVASYVGIGTKFTLRFPVAEGVPAPVVLEEDVPAAPAIDQWKGDGSKRTVLVVDDNVDMRYYLREVLGDDVHVVEAGNGKVALERLKHIQPDVIISDMMMPEMDGREFITRLKSAPEYRQIPIITLTALADMENQLSMLQIGIDDYIVKPFNADELKIRVHNLLTNSSVRKQFIKEEVEAGEVPVVEDNEAANEFRERIRTYVLSKLGNINLSVNDIAMELGYSERQLYRFSKSLTGCTPAQLIKEIRLVRAYELLTTGQVFKIEDLARRVGYEHVSYFSTQFFERFGKRPAEYIK